MTDMNLSSDMQTAFSEHIREKELKLDTDLTVQVLTTGFWPPSRDPISHAPHPPLQVLTTGFWPTYKSDDLNLPKELVACIETFRAFYDGNDRHAPFGPTADRPRTAHAFLLLTPRASLRRQGAPPTAGCAGCTRSAARRCSASSRRAARRRSTT